jgi:EAL domain-containing protein (putative c-di-GMP-specific phosphodiesterase class I)
VYQPIVELTSGRIIGFEALTRFNVEPPQGPDVWFADAAAVGLTLELERAALASAVAGFDGMPAD